MDKLAQINIKSTFLGTNDKLPTELGSVGNLVSNFLTIAISVSGLILLFFLILGGIGIIAGSGESDPQKLEAGKKAATSALIGFIVVISAYWIVKLIELLTGFTLIGF